MAMTECFAQMTANEWTGCCFFPGTVNGKQLLEYAYKYVQTRAEKIWFPLMGVSEMTSFYHIGKTEAAHYLTYVIVTHPVL